MLPHHLLNIKTPLSIMIHQSQLSIILKHGKGDTTMKKIEEKLFSNSCKIQRSW